MKVSYTDGALDDLDDAYQFIHREWPDVLEPFESRLEEIEHLISENPEGGRKLENRRGVFAFPFVRFPYKLFYSFTPRGIEILHIYHTSRHTW